MKEIFGIDSTMRNDQSIGRLRHTPTRVASGKIKRGPAKGKTIKMSVHAHIATLMIRVLKGRKQQKVNQLVYDPAASRFTEMTDAELRRRQFERNMESYSMAGAMNSGDLK